MSDLPVPMVGPVYGWRTWSHSDSMSKWTDAGEASLHSRGTVWDTPLQQARCDTSGLGWMHAALTRSMDAFLYGTTSPEPAPNHQPAADPNCWCGLYAHGTLARCLDANDGPLLLSYATQETVGKVLGLVRAWGRMHAADRGFRAQHMAIDTLICLRHETGPLRWGHQEAVHHIAGDLGVPVVCIKKKGVASVRRQFDRVFASCDGVTLWRKEAPWISELTRRPSKSSTPTKPAGLAIDWWRTADETHQWKTGGRIASPPSLIDRVERTTSLSEDWSRDDPKGAA